VTPKHASNINMKIKSIHIDVLDITLAA